MARQQKKALRQQIGGPFLHMAVLCERVITETDNVRSLIRLVNKFTLSSSLPKLPTGAIEVTAVIGFKRGSAGPRHTLTLRCFDPKGKLIADRTQKARFPTSGPDSGIDFIANIRLPIQEPGRYWFHVLLNDQLVTKMPMLVIYEQIKTGASKTA